MSLSFVTISHKNNDSGDYHSTDDHEEEGGGGGDDDDDDDDDDSGVSGFCASVIITLEGAVPDFHSPLVA